MFNIMKSRELLLARLRKEAGYLMADLSPWHRPVTPFVLVCRQRTGSNMLRYALETHPQVVHYGELFHPQRNAIFGAHGKYMYRPQSLLDWRRADARSFLNDVIYRDAAPPVRAVGFKLFYRHGRDDVAGNPWPVLAERRDIRVLHLVRSNPIASFLSHERMRNKNPHIQMRSGVRRTNGHLVQEAIVVDVEKLAAYLAEYDQEIRDFATELAGHEIFELTYEALTTDPRVLEKVLAFLDVERRTLHFQTVRQSEDDASKRIANRTEVNAVLRGTRWDSAAMP
ncbi:MAG TPA: sulfotransferase [Kofleriaceae bacterium]|nr:sulfotransferase [Kofleriaceae bacterium]